MQKKEVISDAKKYLRIDGLNILSEQCDMDGFSVKRDKEQFVIHYNDRVDLFKALGLISMYGEGITELSQSKRIDHLGYLVDTARNAVPTVKSMKELFIRLASFGYDRVYMYMEDVMQVENEPFYGHLRGRYSFDELKEMDRYADELGIELVPCIQTLAHLNCLFKWPEYAQCNDTADILLIDSDRTYTLINNIFSTINHCFKSKHVHIGMDEAYLAGRGKHMDTYGYEEKHDLLKRHIDMVMNIAGKYGFTAEIWSDMYFREAFGGGYYSADKCLPDEICESIPKSVGLVYWDYWNRDERVIDNMFESHIQTGNEVIFAGGACKWMGWNPSTEFALVLGRKMLAACDRYGIRSVILTAWSDDGAEASLFSALPSIIQYSLHAYGESISDSNVSDALQRYCGLTLDQYRVGDLDFLSESGVEESYLFGKLPKIMLYNDPLSGMYDSILQKYRISEQIVAHKNRLSAVYDECTGSEKKMFEVMMLLCDALEIKWDLGLRLRAAYHSNDLSSLEKIAKVDIPELIRRLSEFKAAFYIQWISENKSNGFQTHDLRIGGMIERLNTVKLLVLSYLNGEISEITELGEDLVPLDNVNAELDMLLWTTWMGIHSVYVI